MAEGVPTPLRFPSGAALAAGAAGIVVAGTLVLWVHYGGAVFFEMIAAGFRACF
jgi:hypothetical protein